jgi:hypothetical protein
MKRPGEIVFVFGNPLALAVLVGGTLYLTYQWWTGQGAPGFAFMAFLAMSYSASCNNELRKYKEWKQDWEAMEGKVPRRATFAWTPAMRFVIGVPLWCILAYVVSTVPQDHDPIGTLAAAAFWLATAFMIVVLIYRGVRALRKPRARSAGKAFSPCVAVCILPPRSSPPLMDAYQQLPDYCRMVLSSKN